MNRKESKNREEHLLLSCAVVVFLVSLAIRLAKLIVDPLIMRDAAQYLDLAEIWFESGRYSDTFLFGNVVPPLHLFSIREMMQLGFSSDVCGRSLALFFGSAIPVLGFLAAYRIRHKIGMAFLMAWILAANPSLVSYSIQPMRENYYMFSMGVILILAIDAWKRQSQMKWMLCGVMCAVALFCRYEALEMIVILPVVMLMAKWKQHLPYHRLVKNLVSFFLAIGVSTILLLSMTGFDASFLNKITRYGGDIEFDGRPEVRIPPN